ncbi:MAG: pseudouridine synthase [Oscillibacter sp.]
MDKQRLDKILASTGRFSRREVKLLVRQGRVLVDGVPPRSAEEKYDPERSTLVVNGEEISYRRHTWLMLNKPGGVLSATEDGRGKTVLDLLPPELQRLGLFPVGRLDKDTEGLLLLTDDGAVAHDLLSPRHHVDKLYFTRVAGRLEAADCAAFEAGMTLDDGLKCLPAGLEILRAGEESEALVTLREGKFHQVKRMLLQRGKPVVYLRRIRMGNLPLDPALELGMFRFLTPEEVEGLQNPTKSLQ